MSDAFIGEIRLVGFNFAPVGWALCNGQLLAISQNTALFSLLGTSFGGDGVRTFALPDLRGRVPLHMGQGPELSNFIVGDSGGQETVTLSINQIPAHNHSLAASNVSGTQSTPQNNYIAGVGRGGFSATANVMMAPDEIGSAGGSQPHTNLQPYLTVNFIIALQGIFPSRN
ncbi:MAG: phage tail protein [Chroococcidiopsidaceae cyanobacterium CP_BM_ER_R8_30]|nr:phage tail protein [Chroococcidiopsidaceae cyanobacterium CP_BM_ER_R8_30]